MIALLSFLSAIVVFIAISARSADHPSKPTDPSMKALVRLHLEKVGLLCMGLGAGAVLIGVLAGKPVDPITALLLFATALWTMAHPNGWWRYAASLADRDTRRTDL